MYLFSHHQGRKAGTLFLGNKHGHDQGQEDETNISPPLIPAVLVSGQKIEEIARGAREGSRKLQGLSSADRSAVLMKIALSLEEREEEILAVNAEDVEGAEKG